MEAISLSPELKHLVQLELDAGRYESPDALVLDAVRRLHERNELIAQILVGKEQLERGEGTSYDRDAWRAKIADIKTQILSRKEGADE